MTEDGIVPLPPFVAKPEPEPEPEPVSGPVKAAVRHAVPTKTDAWKAKPR